MELIDIVKILIPEQQQQYLNQICNALKVVETVELTKLLNDLEGKVCLLRLPAHLLI